MTATQPLTVKDGLGSNVKICKIGSNLMQRSYDNLDDAYRELVSTGVLVRYAKSHLFVSDHAGDCVHDAFVKALKYTNEHPGRKILTRFLYWKVLIATKKYNKFANEVFLGEEELGQEAE